MLESTHRFVVVGAGVAGARTCERLRSSGYPGELLLLGAEPHLPYDRPPLSKGVLRGDRDDTTLSIDLARLGVTARLGTAATGLDLAASVVQTEAGRIGFDGLAIATGARAVTLPGPGEQHTVRTIDDAHRLRARLVPGSRVVVIGASWIGAEVATSALARGCTVTCVEAASAPGSRVLGDDVGKRLLTWWSGVDLRLDAAVDHIGTQTVVLADGTELPSDVVVVGVGARPETAWLQGSGLELDRGVVVDEWLRAAPNVVALGDVAAWWSRRYATRMRVEHWDQAVAGSSTAAAALLHPEPTDADRHDPLPYFWSNQFGHRLQYLGRHDPSADPIWREDDNGWCAAWLDGDGRLAAFLAVDRPRDLLAARQVLTAGGVPDPVQLTDPSVPITEA